MEKLLKLSGIGFAIIVILFGFSQLSTIGNSQIPGQQVPFWGNATKLIDTTNEEFGVAHTAGVLQTIVNSSALPSGASTSANQNSLLTELQLKADLTETQPVSLITGFSTSALQLADSHNVQIKSYTGASQQYPRIDPSTFSWQVINYPHHEIHESNSYHAYVNASGGSGTKATITFKTPSGTNWIHMVLHARGNVESHLTFGESATVTAASGSDFALLNRDRNSDNETGLISEGSTGGALVGNITIGATVTSFGTILQLEHFGNNKVGEESRGTSEWILKANTVYAIELETETASSEAFIEIEFYEHTNKE